MRSLRKAPLALVVFVVSGCPRATDPTPRIEVTKGAADRINLIQSRSGKRAQASAGAKSRVHPLKPGDELGGPNATGRPGDWILENDEVVFVIDALGRGAGFAESGGNVVDAADAKARKDELGQLFTYFGTFPRQAVYSRIDTRVEADGTAVIAASGVELHDPNIAVTTEYRLAGADRALLLRTTLKNGGPAKVTGLGLGDAIQWGGAEKVAPGKPLGFAGRFQGPYVGGVGRFGSYAITSTSGEIAGISGSTWTDTEQEMGVAIAPGASVTYERVFVVGERPDVSSLVAELVKASDGPVGTVRAKLVSAGGAPVAVPRGAKIVFGTDKVPEVLSLVAATSGPVVTGELPPGRWVARYSPSAGRRAASDTSVVVDVKEGKVAELTFEVTEPAEVTFGACEEERGPGAQPERIPCKLTFEGEGGAPAPDFGPAHVAGPAKNQVTLAPSDVVTLPLPHGRYKVTASRGPEYDLAVLALDVPEPSGGAVGPRRLRLARVVDTTGYVATDFHQHSMRSADAPVATRDRVIANAVEGVEVPVATEHNVVADLRPLAKELGLSAFVVPIPGDELTTDASRNPWGHANVYPLAARADDARGGAFKVRDRTAAEVFAEARALPGGPRVVQINHPRAGKTGYFNQLGFDASTGVGSGPGYDAAFDALEVWNGRNVVDRAKVIEDFFALLRTSHPVTPIADTDTHGIVGHEAGYPRTYVRVSRDADLDAWDEARTRDLVKAVRETRDVVLTNGPFVRVSANGAGPGGLARAPKGQVAIKVEVTCAPWVVVERAEVRFARSGKAVARSAALAPKKNARGALVASASFSASVEEDDAVVVSVSGTRPMRPVLSGDEAEIAPFAMTSPIWIDADGDGKALGR